VQVGGGPRVDVLYCLEVSLSQTLIHNVSEDIRLICAKAIQPLVNNFKKLNPNSFNRFLIDL
jgi:hypothetical protein